MGDHKVISLYPVAELHWKNVVRKYHFPDPDDLEFQWSSGCHERLKFQSYDENGTLKAAWKNRNQDTTIQCKSHFQLNSLMCDGYRAYKTLYCKNDNIAVLSMIKSTTLDPRKKNYAIVCVDLDTRGILACLPIKSSDQKESLNHVEVWSCDLSQDGRYLGMAVSLMAEENFFHQSCENFVTIFDVVYKREVKRVWNWNTICSSIAFDPQSDYDRTVRFTLVGMRENMNESDCALATYELNSIEYWSLQKPLNRVLVNNLLDEDGETCFQLSYSKEGYYLILQAMENVAYAREWESKTLIYHAETLTLLYQCKPTIAQACHIDCPPCTHPILSICGTYMALGSFRSKKKREGTVDIEIYKLSSILNLRHQCRVAITRCVTEPQNILQLPLPKILQNYLMWQNPVSMDTSCS